LPDPRQIGRQKTCGKAECIKENHRRQCQQWNRKNRDYFKSIYLSGKLRRTKDPPTAAKCTVAIPASRIKLGLQTDVLIQVTGAKHLVILEYIVAQIIQRVVKSSLHSP
jgi:hypothetical protein